MRKIVFFVYILLGIFVFSTTCLAADSKSTLGTYFWSWNEIQQFHLVKEGQGGYSIEIWPFKNFRPTGELGRAPLKYYGGPEVVEIANMMAEFSNQTIRGVTYETSKILGGWGRSYISGGKKIPMYKIRSFFLYPRNMAKFGKVGKSAEVINGGLQPGWCCANGQIFPATPPECHQKGGSGFSIDRNEVLELCKEAPQETGHLAPHRGDRDEPRHEVGRDEPRHEVDPDEPRHEVDRGDATPVTLP